MFKVMSTEKNTRTHWGIEMGYRELGANVAKGGQRVKKCKKSALPKGRGSMTFMESMGTF